MPRFGQLGGATGALIVVSLAAELAAQPSGSNQAVQAIFVKVETAVNELATALEASYSSWTCGLDAPDTASCYYETCKDRFPKEQCSATGVNNFGGCGGESYEYRVLDCTTSGTKTKIDPTLASGEQRDRIQGAYRYTSVLDPIFIRNMNGNDQFSWQYTGTPDGVTRMFPGAADEVCHQYDPRVRNWYVAATSGPKDVVIVVDVSGSMDQYNRMNLMKGAVKQVLATLDQKDYVAVVTFSSSARQVIGDVRVNVDTRQGSETRTVTIRENSLTKATIENVKGLTSLVDDLQAGGGTNFKAAFDKAFSVIRETGSDFSSGCQPTVIFLTDGEDGSALVSEIAASRLALGEKKPNIFTFTLGSNADITKPKDIACQTEGIWNHVPEGADLRTAMASYYDYYATTRADGASEVSWVEEYLDGWGAGWMTTASKAVYDKSTTPPTLIAVVSIDVLIDTLEQAAKSDGADLLALLSARNAQCVEIAKQNDCSLIRLRAKEYGSTTSNSLLFKGAAVSEVEKLCPDDALKKTELNCPGSTINCNTGLGPGSATAPSPPSQQKTLILKCTEMRGERYDSDPNKYQNMDTVCEAGECSSHQGGDDDGLSTGAIVGIIIAVFVVILVICAVCVWLRKRQAARDNGPQPATSPHNTATNDNAARAEPDPAPPSYRDSVVGNEVGHTRRTSQEITI